MQGAVLTRIESAWRPNLLTLHNAAAHPEPRNRERRLRYPICMDMTPLATPAESTWIGFFQQAGGHQREHCHADQKQRPKPPALPVARCSGGRGRRTDL